MPKIPREGFLFDAVTINSSTKISRAALMMASLDALAEYRQGVTTQGVTSG